MSTSSTCRIGGLPALNDGNNARAVLYNRLIDDIQRADVHLGRQQRPGREHHRRPGRGHEGDERRLVHHQGDLAERTTARTQLPSTTCTRSRSRGPRRGRRLQARDRRARRGDLHHRRPGSPARPVAGTTRCRPATPCSTALRWPHRRRPARPRCCVSAAKHSTRASSTAAQLRRLQLHGPLHPGLRRVRAGQRPDQRQPGLEPAQDDPSRWTSPHASRCTRCSAASLQTRASAPASTTARASRPGSLHPHVHVHPHVRSNRPVLTTCAGSATTARSARRTTCSSARTCRRATSLYTRSPGMHSAILNLDDPSTDGIDYQTMNTVIAPDVFTAGNTTRSRRPDSQAATMWIASSSACRPATRCSRSTCPARRQPGHGPGALPALPPLGPRRRLERQHVVLRTVRSRAAPRRPVQPDGQRRAARGLGSHRRGQAHVRRRLGSVPLTASLFGVAVSPNPDVIPTRRSASGSRSYSLQNNFASFTGQAVGSTLRQRPEGRVHDRRPAPSRLLDEVPGRLDSFRATIGGPSDAAADLDLFVYQCTTRLHDVALRVRVQTATPRSRSRSRTRRPVPGSSWSTA